MPRSEKVHRDIAIYEMHRQGFTNSEIAREMKVSPATVCRVVSSGAGKSPVVEVMRRIEKLELEASLLAECMFWFSKFPSPLGQHTFQRVKSILSRWPTPLVREMYLNEKLELHTGYHPVPQR